MESFKEHFDLVWWLLIGIGGLFTSGIIWFFKWLISCIEKIDKNQTNLSEFIANIKKELRLEIQKVDDKVDNLALDFAELKGEHSRNHRE